MEKPSPISDAEWEVMNVLWTAASAMTANEVVAELGVRREWSPRTIKTMLNRLIKKQAIKFQQQDNRYLYRPAIGREQCIRAASRSFLSRVFGGSAGPMLVHFVTHTELSPAEIESLQMLLSQKESAGKPRLKRKKER